MIQCAAIASENEVEQKCDIQHLENKTVTKIT